MISLSVGMSGCITVASPEALVIDNDMLGAILRSVRGIDVTPDAIDLDAMECVVGGDGHDLGEPQTLELMKSEYIYPRLGADAECTSGANLARFHLGEGAIPG